MKRVLSLLVIVLSLGCDKSAALVDAGQRRVAKGDINGDGFADFLIGAPNSSATLSQSGQAFVFLGGKDLLAQPLLTIGSDIVLDQLGKSVAMAGDVNGDGYGDFMVMTNGNDTNVGTQAGRVLLFFGGPTLKATPDIIFGAGVVDDSNGPMAGCGDLNGDGYDDIAFAAMNVDARHTGILPARVEIHFGGPAMATSPPLVLFGEDQPNFFGSSLSAAGDVNGDGYPDLIVGSHPDTGGKVRIYFGGPAMDAVADVVLEAPAESRLFGFSVAGVGDINGDGYADVAVGAPSTDGGNPSTPGKVFVYFGGSQPHLTPDVVLPGNHQGAWFGMVVAPAGDLDHDGYDDLAVLERGLPEDLLMTGATGQVATPGKVFLYRGGVQPELAPFATIAAGADFPVNRSLAVLDLDGESEILVGQWDRYPSTPVTGQVAIYRRSNNYATPALIIPNLASSDSWFGSTISR
jgi:hypothetical protein